MKAFEQPEIEPVATSKAIAGIVERLIRDTEGAAILSCSKATWWRRVADGTMPQPVRIGSMTRWKLSEVMASINELSLLREPKPEMRDGSRTANLQVDLSRTPHTGGKDHGQ